MDCSRPLLLTATAQKHAQTGQVRAVARSQTFTACGTRWAQDCRGCSETYRARSHLAIRSGLPVDEWQTAALVTLTAPSFGAVHSAGWHSGRPKPDRPRRCHPGRCGQVHSPDDRRVVGSPLDPDGYDYEGQVRWNESAGLLWSSFRHALTRALGSWADLAQVCRVVEPQRRGATHFHIVVVVRSSPLLGERLEPNDLAELVRACLPVSRAARRAARREAAALGLPEPAFYDGPSALARDGSGERLTFGTESDVRPLVPGRTGWNGVAGYLAKYLTKSVGGAGAERLVPASPIVAHLDRLAALATDRARASWPARHAGRDPRRGDLTRAGRGLGYTGPPRSSSRHYGLTLTALRTAACAHARAGLPPDPWEPVWEVAPPEVVAQVYAALPGAPGPRGP